MPLSVPDFDVRINGTSLSEEAKADVIVLAVHEDVGAPGMFTMQLYNWDREKLQVKWVDDRTFAEGNEVQVQMGYLDGLETLLVGEVTGLEPAFSADDFTLTVRGYDLRHRLLRGRKTRSFVQMKDSDIARQIAIDAGLRAQAQDSKVKLDYVLQHNQTDMEFLQARARRIGYEVVVEDKTLHFRLPQTARKEVLTLSLEEQIVEFYPRLTTMTQVGQIEAHGWIPKEKKAVVGQAGVGKETTKMGGRISGPQSAKQAFGSASSGSVRSPVFSQAEADQMALGRFNDMALAYINGEGVCLGLTALRAGVVIKIEGLGKRFSGLYYVTSATHTVSPKRGYRTAFTVRRNAT